LDVYWRNEIQPKIYNYLDADAPVLDDAPGSLIAILDACLVTGYGEHEQGGVPRAAAANTIDTAYTVNSGEIAISGNPVAYMPGTISALAPGEYVGTFDGFLPGTLTADVTSTDLKLDYVWTSRIVMRNSVSATPLNASHGATTSPRSYIPGLLVPCLPLDTNPIPVLD
jgi:hypothetical protein